MLMISPSGSVDFKIMISDQTKCMITDFNGDWKPMIGGGWTGTTTSLPCCYHPHSLQYPRKCDSNYILENGRQICNYRHYLDWECNDPTQISTLVGKTFIADGKDHVVGIRYTSSLKKYDLIIDGVIEST